MPQLMAPPLASRTTRHTRPSLCCCALHSLLTTTGPNSRPVAPNKRLSWRQHDHLTILTALTSFLSFLAGLWASTYLQDRETRRKHLGIVRALKAEVARIRRESGGQSGQHIPITFLG